MYGYEELSLAAREALHAEVTALEWSVAYAKKGRSLNPLWVDA